MNGIGVTGIPVRVAIIGAGPAGFYSAEHLLRQKDILLEIDMFDRLPTPYGLVRGGVAPDHQKIKSVTKAYERTAKRSGFRYFGYVEYGKDIGINDLIAHYHQIIFATGTQKGKILNIIGAELDGNHAASDFVSWYNGHPDFNMFEFDLTQERVAVIGIGESDTGNRVPEAVEQALTHPLLDVDYKGASGALIHITCGPDLKLEEFDLIGRTVSDNLNAEANVIIGARINKDFTGKVRVITIMTGVKSPYILGDREDEQKYNVAAKEMSDLGIEMF